MFQFPPKFQLNSIGYYRHHVQAWQNTGEQHDVLASTRSQLSGKFAPESNALNLSSGGKQLEEWSHADEHKKTSFSCAVDIR